MEITFWETVTSKEEQAINKAARLLSDFTANTTNRVSFIKGAKSPEAKAFHTKGMYSEEEVVKLFEQYQSEFSLYRNIQVTNVDFLTWFEQNKKVKE